MVGNMKEVVARGANLSVFAAGKDGIRHDSHEADFPPAIDEGVPLMREPAPQLLRCFCITFPAARDRPAIDCDIHAPVPSWIPIVRKGRLPFRTVLSL